MSTQTEITRIQSARNKIRNKLINLGLATAVDKLDSLADSIDDIVNVGAINVEVREGESYTVPAGFHNGGGIVKGVSGGGNYQLQAKTATPTKSQQAITSDAGYYGLSGVTVEAIPDAYQDVSPVTATAPDVLANKIIVNAEGETVAGTMANFGSVAKQLYPGGHDAITGDSNKLVMGKGHVEAINVTVKDAGQLKITPAMFGVAGSSTSYYSGYDGSAIAHNGSINKTIDGLTTTSVAIPTGYTAGGTVSLTSDIEEALAAI